MVVPAVDPPSFPFSLPLAHLSLDPVFLSVLFSFLLWFLIVKKERWWLFLVVDGCGCCSGGGCSVSLSSPVVCSSGVFSFDFLTF